MRLKWKRTAAILAALYVCAGIAAAAAPAADPQAAAVVQRYLNAMHAADFDRAYSLLTASQQTYFGDEHNFASNYTATGYRLLSYALKQSTRRNAGLVQVDVAEKFTFYDIAAEQTNAMAALEPYFALRENGRWGVKELFEPWKTYAPNVTAGASGFYVTVDRVEFYDRRVQIDCTLRDVGKRAIAVLPLLKSHLRLVPGVDAAAMSDADFPLNDRQFFEGVRLYPGHQIIGYLNFGLSSRADADAMLTLTVGPAIADGANEPMQISVGPIRLQKL